MKWNLQEAYRFGLSDVSLIQIPMKGAGFFDICER